MADNLRTRVGRVIAGGAHALLDKIEDTNPSAMLAQSVREVDQVTGEVRAELGRVAASRHLAQQQHLRLNKEHDALSTDLATAMTAEREDLARAAIARQLDIEAQLPVLESSLGQLSQEDKELSGFVDALMGKKREMEQAIQDFEASRRAAENPLSRQGAGSGKAAAKLASAQSSFDQTFRRQTGINAAAHGTSLEQAARLKELNELTRENKISERLAALKPSN